MSMSRMLVVIAAISVCGVVIASQRLTLPSAPVTPAEVAVKQGERRTSTDPSVNPDAAAMKEFKTRVEHYVELHRQLAKGAAEPKDMSDPADINAAKVALAGRIQAARKDAKHGDIFTPEVRAAFRRLLAPELKGEDGRDAKAVIRDDAPAPGSVPFKVNAKYPEGQPFPSVPAQLLLTLPPLEAPLEYRIIGQHLLLIDTASDLIVDYVRNAITL